MKEWVTNGWTYRQAYPLMEMQGRILKVFIVVGKTYPPEFAIVYLESRSFGWKLLDLMTFK